jgi:nicotinamidase-related amidase
MAALTGRHQGLLAADDVGLLVVDLQDGFRPVIDDFENIVRNCRILVEGFGILDAPVIVSEQYPKGLGHTVAEVASALPPGTPVVEKLQFSVVGVDDLDTAITASGRRRWVVCGIEAHVCVNQSVHDLIAHGHDVTLASDAIGSRTPANRQVGIDKCHRAGAVVSSTETVLFEMLEHAGSDQFKAISKLVR